jgi:hypothetical protein
MGRLGGTVHQPNYENDDGCNRPEHDKQRGEDYDQFAAAESEHRQYRIYVHNSNLHPLQKNIRAKVTEFLSTAQSGK